MDWLVGDDYGDLQEGATTLIGETETHARTFSTLEDASVSVFAARRMKTRAFVLVGVKIELRSCLIVNVHSASAARQVKGMPDLSFHYFRETKTRKRLIWKGWTLNIVNYLEYSPYVGGLLVHERNEWLRSFGSKKVRNPLLKPVGCNLLKWVGLVIIRSVETRERGKDDTRFGFRIFSMYMQSFTCELDSYFFNWKISKYYAVICFLLFAQ